MAEITNLFKLEKRMFSYDLITSPMAPDCGVLKVRSRGLGTTVILGLGNHSVKHNSEFNIWVDAHSGLVVLEVFIGGS